MWPEGANELAPVGGERDNVCNENRADAHKVNPVARC